MTYHIAHSSCVGLLWMVRDQRPSSMGPLHCWMPCSPAQATSSQVIDCWDQERMMTSCIVIVAQWQWCHRALLFGLMTSSLITGDCLNIVHTVHVHISGSMSSSVITGDYLTVVRTNAYIWIFIRGRTYVLVP